MKFNAILKINLESLNVGNGNSQEVVRLGDTYKWQIILQFVLIWRNERVLEPKI